MDYYRLKLTKSKLKAISGTSSLMAGFAMVAMVEMSLEYNSYNESIEKSYKKSENVSDSNSLFTFSNYTNETEIFDVPNSDEFPDEKYIVPRYVLVLYVITTCLLVGVHMLALMISTCILPQVEATAEQMEFERNLRKFEEKEMKKAIDDPSLPSFAVSSICRIGLDKFDCDRNFFIYNRNSSYLFYKILSDKPFCGLCRIFCHDSCFVYFYLFYNSVL